MNTKETLFLIDGTALAYRMYFALIKRPLTNSKGENTSAVFGFSNAILSLLNKEQPDYLVVVFDSDGATFRHEMYEEYKATRERMPDDLYAQIPIIKELTRAMGIPVLEQKGVEADDLIGSLATRMGLQGTHVQIMSSDKDFAQLVTSNVILRDPGRGGRGVKLIDTDGVIDKFGIRPEQIIDYLALVGDSSDNVPGVPKIGPKTAVKLLTEFDTIEGIYANLDAHTKSMKTRLVENKDLAELSRALVTIRTDLLSDVTLEELQQQEKNIPELERILKELEFHKLLQQLTSDTPTQQVRVETHYTQIKDLEALHSCIERIREHKTVSLAVLYDYEERVQTSYGLSMCLEEHKAWYISLQDGAPLAPKDVLDALRPILEDPTIAKTGHQLKEVWIALDSRGIHLKGIEFDSMLASYLLNATLPKHDLSILATQFLNRDKIQEKDLLGTGRKKQTWGQLFVEEQTRYACEEVDLAHQLVAWLRPKVSEAGLDTLMNELELPLIPVLGRMERNGIALDIDKLTQMAEQLNEEQELTLQNIQEWADNPDLNVNSSKQIAELLFEKMKLHELLGVKLRKNRKSGSYSTDSETLEALSQHELPRLILEYRGKQKLLSTYIEALPKLVQKDAHGTPRIHTRFKQTGTVTGRLSSFSPNLQNIPVRTEQGRAIRTTFVPGQQGWVLLSADYSQIELRILAHVSGDEELQYAFREGIDIHTRTASLIFNIFPEFVDPEQRSAAKATNFGLIYGIGPARLAKQIGVKVEEAERFMSAYFQSYPNVKEYLSQSLKNAKKNKYVETLLGRIRRLHNTLDSEDARARAHAENIAVNTPIQGTAADLIKKAMIAIQRRLDEEGFQTRMLLQVHDELVFEAPAEEVERVQEVIRHEMAHAIQLDVPLIVDIGKGTDWSQAH